MGALFGFVIDTALFCRSLDPCPLARRHTLLPCAADPKGRWRDGPLGSRHMTVMSMVA